MKKLIAATSMLFAVGTAGATDSWFGDCTAMVGIDAKWSHIGDESAWSNVFKKSFPGFSVYAGTKFTENFGAELGYDTTAKRSKDLNLTTANSVGGVTVPNDLSIKSSVRFSGPHLDFVGYWPADNNMELFVSLGIGWVKPSAKIERVSGTESDFSRDLVSVSGKHKAIARVGVGATYMASDSIGLRAKFLYENISRLRLKSNAVTPTLTNLKPWKDGYSLALGVFYKF